MLRDVSARTHRLYLPVLATMILLGCGPKNPPTPEPASPATASPRTEPVTTDPARFSFRTGDRIALVGGALAERMQHAGWLESGLQVVAPNERLSFYNLGFSADELTIHQRTAGFGSQDDYLRRTGATVVFAFYGFNESFRDVDGEDDFRTNLRNFVGHIAAMEGGDGGPMRLVLFSPIPYQGPLNDKLPAGTEMNARLERYTRIISDVARESGTPFVDIFHPMQAIYRLASGRLTINGIHLNASGQINLARVILKELLGVQGVFHDHENLVARVRKAVLEKNLLWFNRYRATDGYNVYGGRSKLRYTDGISNFEVLQREMEILDALVECHTRRIHALAAGEENPPLDLDGVPEPIVVKTNRPGPLDGGAYPFLSGEEALTKMRAAPGMQVTLFADEAMFPELVNPVQMSFDTKGRLWVAVWPSYPHWKPGDAMDDKLLVLTDDDQDGKADRCDVFAGGLHNPTGFEFWNGGVFVANAPDILFLRDEDGDGRADRRERILHGLSSADTHHSANSFVLGPGGSLYFQEGVFHQTQIETIYGPVRNHDACVWRFDPRTWRVERHIPYGFANPHGHVFDRWGSEFVTDGTGNVNYFAWPFSGRTIFPDKHRGYFPFFRQRSRPAAATEILSSEAFPEENQGNYLIANVIGFQGIFQYRVHDDGSGFSAEEVEPIVSSTDPNFRPVDIEMGPDGAIYFLDWQNPLIGHMQHHLRDPSRDHTHGRVYRVSHADARIEGKADLASLTTPVLVTYLGDPDDRVRYRTRIALSERPTDEVLREAVQWYEGIAPDSPARPHALLELLWLHQQHAVADVSVLEAALGSDEPRVRAAALRVLAEMRHRWTANPLPLLARAAEDSHPRVRLAAAVACSYFDDFSAVKTLLGIRRRPTDRFLDYAIAESLRTLEGVWKKALQSDSEGARSLRPEEKAFLIERLATRELRDLPRGPAVWRALLVRHDADGEDRLAAARALARDERMDVASYVARTMLTLESREDPHREHVLSALAHLIGEVVDKAAASKTLWSLAETAETPALERVAIRTAFAAEPDPSRLKAFAARSEGCRRAALDALATLRGEAVPEPLFHWIADLARERRDESAAPRPGLSCAFYRGRPKNARIETFRALEPLQRTHADQPDLNSVALPFRDRFGLLFKGEISIPTTGDYVFFTDSDDGSRLYIDGVEVVDNDGDHGMREQSGAVRLEKGRHDFALTYFDAGGDDGLVVSWKGPGLPKAPIPADRFSTSPRDALRAAALRALGRVPGHFDVKAALMEDLLRQGRLVDEAIALAPEGSASTVNEDSLRRMVAALTAYLAQLPKALRTQPRALAALATGRRLARSLPAAESSGALRRLKDLGGTVILMATLPHEMRYDRSEIWVRSGEPVSIVFRNNDVMPHNLVIGVPGSWEKIGRAGEDLKDTGNGLQNYVPRMDEVLWHTDLLLPGKSTRLDFIAPKRKADHPYLCTFPGHWRVMNGVMHVVDTLPVGANAARSNGAEADSPQRAFVKMWKLSDFGTAFRKGWLEGRDAKRGRRMFTEAGCVRCHKFGDLGPGNPVDISRVATKYQGIELLRQVIEPSAHLLEGFENHFFTTKDGESVMGRIVYEDDEKIVVNPNLQEPEKLRTLAKASIASRKRLVLSPMPTGLLVTLSHDEILDLIAFLQNQQ